MGDIRMCTRTAIAALALLLSAPAAWAQTNPPSPAATAPPPEALRPPASPGGGDARYTFSHVADGYLRLDSQTGQVSLCSQRQVGWACQLVPDDRLVLDAEIARLQSENGRLKKELLAHGIALPKGLAAPAPADPGAKDTKNDAQAKQDLDRTLKTLTAAWTRFVEMIASLTRNVMNRS